MMIENCNLTRYDTYPNINVLCNKYLIKYSVSVLLRQRSKKFQIMIAERMLAEIEGRLMST